MPPTSSRAVALLVVLGCVVVATRAQTAQPQVSQTTQPMPTVQPPTRPTQRSAEDMLRQMLQPQGQGAQPLKPIADLGPTTDITGGTAAVIPNAATQPLTSEGITHLDRLGRLTPSPDGVSFEINFDSDGKSLADPPMILLPNSKLQQLEDRVQNSYSDLKLRVSGEVMQYRGRNYLLLQRWTVVPDNIQPLR